VALLYTVKSIERRRWPTTGGTNMFRYVVTNMVITGQIKRSINSRFVPNP